MELKLLQFVLNMMGTKCKWQNEIFEFLENSLYVLTINLINLFSFAFAETSSEEEIQKAIKGMDSKEIQGRRLRVRSSKDKTHNDKDGQK